MSISLRALARALCGEVFGDQVLAPGPGHSFRDRSLSVRLSPNASDGFCVHSFAGDDWRVCRDYVRERLGLHRETVPHSCREACRRPNHERRDEDNRAGKIALALALWREGVDPRGTLADMYLASRGLVLDDDTAGQVLRWHPGLKAMLTLFRNIATDEPQAVSRTFLDPEGRKIERKLLGAVGDAAVKLDPDERVLGGLHIGEGIETCLAARQLGLRPVWALGSKGAIASFPVLSGVEVLTILAEPDAEKEIEACAQRWDATGREVLINHAIGGKDLNDALRARP